MGRFYALIVIFAILAILIYLPSFWVRHVMSKHGRELVGLPGTEESLPDTL